MAEAKTKPTAVSVEAFIAAVEDPRRRDDAAAATALLGQATGLAPTMWGPTIIGFGRYHYRYDSGHEGDAPLVAFAPRKANLVFYMAAYEDARVDFLNRLGKHKSGKGCIYVNRLSDIDPDVLAEMAQWSMKTLQARYPA
ncbi:DUF1801 domain-containing protein [Brevundimonas subvibrioides]|uniref:YdhG-like domain-containing protein n=1 Tax=Brevundimonas subvibrioides (strain ATCC 15264 / DSM 4735 / LMG 14903 / NBRC 16000 / CB 81) TaxID=633149 RepID=D9QH35_BRESC|nr:DUF1801 domain-containing protein [Brevundimonas subvibrioides]ADL01001.1 Domain of unknown function DUF1801 [Brevundimonas subvibrioides ATCC 15264]